MLRPLGFFFLLALGAIAAPALSLWRRAHPNKAEAGLVAEGTIQSVSKVLVRAGRYSHSVDVGDFSYIVNDEYYSGRLTISRSFSTHDASLEDLVNQKIQVRYDPQKPESYYVPQQELGGFLLDPYDEPNASDIGPIGLNIDKV
jgi:hypothetical protein